MNRNQYFSELEAALAGIGREERDSALQYYAEYFDEAGSENENSVIVSLGKPSALAAQIKAELAVRGLEPQKPKVLSGEISEDKPKQLSGIGTIWTVIIAILALPIGFPIAIALIAVIIAILIALFSVIVSLFAVVITLLIYGLVSGIAGFSLIFTDFATALFYIGMGFVSLGLFVFLGIGVVKLSRLLVKGVAKLFNRIRRKLSKKERAVK